MTEREQLGTRGGAFPADVGLMVRKAGGEVDVVPLQSARLSVFDAAVPWRDFRWYRGQRHFSGSYWSATMQAHVGHESRLEYANLLLADFDPRVDWILSQPFLLEGEDKGTRRRHIPDYLIVHADHTVCVVERRRAGVRLRRHRTARCRRPARAPGGGESPRGPDARDLGGRAPR